MAIQNLSFADLLASAQRASSSPVLNMGPPSPTQTLRITPSPSQTLTLSPTFGQTAPKPTATTVPISLPVQEMPYEDLIQATVVQPEPQPVAQTQQETKPASYDDRVKSLTSELERMYGTVTEYAPTAKYGGRQSDLTKIHTESAKKLAAKGVSSLAQLTERTDESGKRFLINRETGDVISEIKKDRDTGAPKWGDILGGVKDGANLAVQFDAEGRAIFFPVHEKTKPLGQQLLGRDLAAFIEPIATIVGAYYGGVPGAMIGSASGQYVGTGEIDTKRVLTAGAAAYAGSIETGGYATSVGNALLPSSLANTAVAKIVGNSIVNSGMSGLMAVATNGDVGKSMVTGLVVGGAIASAPDIANTLMGGEANVQAVADATGLGLRQAQEIIATSVADGIVADARNESGFGTALGQSLVSRGVSTAAANQAVNFVANNLTKNPDALRVVFDTARGAGQVAINAALNEQNVGEAVKNAAPGIVLQAGLTLTARPEDERVAALPPSEGGIQVAGDLGFSDGLDILEQLKAQRLPDETEIDVQTQEVDGVLERRTLVEGVRNDGMPYQYTIITDEFGNTFYEYNPEPFSTVVTRDRPDIKGQTGSFAIPAPFLQEYNALIDLREFGDYQGNRRAVIGGGGYGTGSTVGFNFIGIDSQQREKYDVGGESFTLFVLPNIKMLASDITDKVYYVDVQLPPETTPDLPTNLKLTPKTVDEVKTELTQPKKTPLKPGEEAAREAGVTGAEGAEGAAGTPGGATPGETQERLQKELAKLEQELQDAEKQFQQTQINLARALEQRERLSAPNLVAAVGPDLQASLDQELRDLEAAELAARQEVESLGTRISDIGASQQESDAGRPSSEVIGDLVRGGFGQGLPGDEGAGTGGLRGGEGPGAGAEGAGLGAGEEGEGPGAGAEGVGPGAGEEGEGVGGGGEGDGGVTEITPLRPTVIFGGPEDRPVAPFASRVTGEALAGILGAKEPLFGGDPDEQRAVWNRRSLRLRRALGL